MSLEVNLEQTKITSFFPTINISLKKKPFRNVGETDEKKKN